MARFIVVEGIDGSGTSTQVAAIAHALTARGEEAEITAEPTDGTIGRMIREILAARLAPNVDNRTLHRMLAFLYAADRQEHLENFHDGVGPHLSAGRHVCCSRYVLSSLAYESSDADELQFVQKLNEDFRIPDLTVYLDCPVEVSMERLTSTRPHLDIFENQSELTRVHANYERLIADYPGVIHRADATGTADAITAGVIDALDALE